MKSDDNNRTEEKSETAKKEQLKPAERETNFAVNRNRKYKEE